MRPIVVISWTCEYADLSYQNIDFDELEFLCSSPTLTSLNLSGNTLLDYGAKILAKSTTLTTLKLYDTEIENAGAEALSKNTILTWLNLGGNKIGDAGTEALAKNTTLTYLDLELNDKIGIYGKVELEMMNQRRAVYPFDVGHILLSNTDLLPDIIKYILIPYLRIAPVKINLLSEQRTWNHFK